MAQEDVGASASATFRQSRKSFMPLKLRNISQLSGVSSVMFHRALQENSITWSHCRGGEGSAGTGHPELVAPDTVGCRRWGRGGDKPRSSRRTYNLVQQLLLDQLQHGLWAESSSGQRFQAPGTHPQSPGREGRAAEWSSRRPWICSQPWADSPCGFGHSLSQLEPPRGTVRSGANNS